MAQASLEEYKKLIADRPEKFTEEEVGYRKADAGEPQCRGCLHFFERRLDKFAVCEIMRSERTDEEGVNPTWVCNFQTVDMEKFPLSRSLKEK